MLWRGHRGTTTECMTVGGGAWMVQSYRELRHVKHLYRLEKGRKGDWKQLCNRNVMVPHTFTL